MTQEHRLRMRFTALTPNSSEALMGGTSLDSLRSARPANGAADDDGAAIIGSRSRQIYRLTG